jgi:hypothetical protein
MTREDPNPRKLFSDKTFIPAEINEGVEYYVNGIFEFNITRLNAYIKSNPDLFIPETLTLSEIINDFSVINERYMHSVILKEPVILAEIAPDRYNLIDGNHRIEKARRLGLEFIEAYRLSPGQHIRFLSTRKAYNLYISYWNDKLSEA